MNAFAKLAISASLVVAFTTALSAQCQTWNDSDRKAEAENAHVIYRPFVKDKQPADLAKMTDTDFKIAFDNWKTAYDIAPAADGQRPFHFSDGRLLYKALREKTEDAALKKEYADMIMKLYDEQMKCFSAEEAFLLGRKGFDMFYMPEFGYRKETFETLKKAIDKGGDNTEYVVYEPMSQVLVYLYQNKQIDKAAVIDVAEKLEQIAQHNAKNNQRYGQYYEAALARMNSHIAPIEDEVFDCDYFKKKLLPQYQANPEDLEVIKYVYNKLRMQGCDSTDTDLNDLRANYEKLATEINAQLEADRRANNPGYDASQLQQEGKYDAAVTRYREAIDKTEDPIAKAQYYYSIAFIQTWQFSQYQAARDNARRAASLHSGWGKPYILIGDIYAKTSRSCGDDWDNRMAILAALEKYAYARSIDSEVAEEANRKIGIYSSSRPEKQEGFMRGIKEGQSVRVGCWIGETVQVRFQ